MVSEQVLQAPCMSRSYDGRHAMQAMQAMPAGQAPGQAVQAAANGQVPAALFGRRLRSPPSSSAEAQVSKPIWIIEEVINFDAAEEEADYDSFETVCHPKMFPNGLLGGCVLWNCTEEDELQRKKS
ncbi:unnamed protein product [Cladocopium goreaui]|uniref:NPL4-like protein 1 n=1 Tax=Cladocopium goreaui TaxID=2562237 RepID=A0A9P1FI49_9DINO|nr:unnamed protein product [Cladocopium goreaui]